MEEKKRDLLHQIREKMPAMSKGHRAIAAYILQHYEKVVQMTALEIGKKAEVSESTVVRFAMELGYSGYPKFQKELQEILKSKLTSFENMRAFSKLKDSDDLLGTVVQHDIRRLKETYEKLDRAKFKQAVEMICRAKNIYVMGIRSASPLALYLTYYLTNIFENVKLIQTTSLSESFEQIYNMSENDAIIGISFPRYSKNTIRVLDYAKSTGAGIIGITDVEESPIAQLANISLLTPGDRLSFAESLVAPLSVINAFVVAIGMQTEEQLNIRLRKLEKIWAIYDVYNKD